MQAKYGEDWKDTVEYNTGEGVDVEAHPADSSEVLKAAGESKQNETNLGSTR